jgi:hypothetical protein
VNVIPHVMRKPTKGGESSGSARLDFAPFLLRRSGAPPISAED